MELLLIFLIVFIISAGLTYVLSRKPRRVVRRRAVKAYNRDVLGRFSKLSRGTRVGRRIYISDIRRQVGLNPYGGTR